MKKLLSITLALLMLLPLIAGCTQQPAQQPETDAPETDAPETDAPETDAPETNAPETDAPETDAPETDAPETEAPETDAPEDPLVSTAAAGPIKEYDFEKFIPEDKNDPNCTVGFVLQTRKYTYNSNDILVIHVTNTTNTDYSMRLTIKYTDKNGDTIEGLRDAYPDFGAG